MIYDDTSAVNQRTMPHSQEAEQAVLGGLLLDPRLTATVSPRLTPESFYFERNAWIFRALQALGEEADLRTVQAWLEDHGSPVQLSYLTGLDLALPDIGNLDAYAEIVLERSLRRRIIDAAGQTLRNAFDGSVPAVEVAGQGLARYSALSAEGQKGGFRTAIEVFEDWATQCEDATGKHKEPGILTGIGKLDFLTGGMERKHMWLLGGRPGHGKTSLLLQIIGKAALDQERHCAVFSLEMSERELLLRLMAQRTGLKTVALRRGGLTPAGWAVAYQFMQKVRASGRIHVDDQGGLNALEIGARLRRLKAKYPIGCVFVDYLTLMGASSREVGFHRTSENAKLLSDLCKDEDVAGVVCAQLSRSSEKSDRRPQLSDLRDGGEEPAWGVMLLHRARGEEGLTNDGEVIVDKNRSGTTGVAKVLFDGLTQRFEPA